MSDLSDKIKTLARDEIERQAAYMHAHSAWHVHEMQRRLDLCEVMVHQFEHGIMEEQR